MSDIPDSPPLGSPVRRSNDDVLYNDDNGSDDGQNDGEDQASFHSGNSSPRIGSPVDVQPGSPVGEQPGSPLGEQPGSPDISNHSDSEDEPDKEFDEISRNPDEELQRSSKRTAFQSSGGTKYYDSSNGTRYPKVPRHQSPDSGSGSNSGSESN